jgi:hypothetical protein
MPAGVVSIKSAGEGSEREDGWTARSVDGGPSYALPPQLWDGATAAAPLEVRAAPGHDTRGGSQCGSAKPPLLRTLSRVPRQR